MTERENRSPPPSSQLMVGDQLDEATKSKLREALRFSASRSVLSSEDERRILNAMGASQEVVMTQVCQTCGYDRKAHEYVHHALGACHVFSPSYAADQP